MGWRPGAWLGRNCEDEFAYDSYIAACGREMLNADARIVPLADLLAHDLDRFFIRPVSDAKLFAGTVLDRAEAAAWRERIRGADDTWTITPETPVMVATVKPILTETRFVVVDGEVVTGSLYRRVVRCRDRPAYLGLCPGKGSRLDPRPRLRARRGRHGRWPQDIEFNSFNSAGWYDSDVSRIVQAIEGMS